MKKIDLHIHTKASVTDQPFDFALESLVAYVNEKRIAAIAITNHNLFDLGQYQMIISKIDIPVFPGIEIDIEKSHLLLIADLSDVADFYSRCDQITAQIKSKDDYISFETFGKIFLDFSKYILIPHYDKKPAMSKDTIAKYGDNIHAGEVSSKKKFIYCYRDPREPVSVLFSDIRIRKELTEFPSKATYLNIGDISFAAIKSA